MCSQIYFGRSIISLVVLRLNTRSVYVTYSEISWNISDQVCICLENVSKVRSHIHVGTGFSCFFKSLQFFSTTSRVSSTSRVHSSVLWSITGLPQFHNHYKHHLERCIHLQAFQVNIWLLCFIINQHFNFYFVCVYYE